MPHFNIHVMWVNAAQQIRAFMAHGISKYTRSSATEKRHNQTTAKCAKKPSTNEQSPTVRTQLEEAEEDPEEPGQDVVRLLVSEGAEALRLQREVGTLRSPERRGAHTHDHGRRRHRPPHPVPAVRRRERVVVQVREDTKVYAHQSQSPRLRPQAHPLEPPWCFA